MVRILGLLLLLAATDVAPALAQDDLGTPLVPATPVETEALTPVEEWVQLQVSNGMPADLEKYPGDPNVRILSATFVKRLLTRPPTQGGQPLATISISSATITGPLDVREVRLPFNVTFRDCTFDSTVDFSGSAFEGSLSLENNHFRALNLSRVTTEGSLILNGSTIGSSFVDFADFSQARIGRDLSVQDVRFGDDTRYADFSRMHVEGSAYLNRSTFNGVSQVLLIGIRRQPRGHLIALWILTRAGGLRSDKGGPFGLAQIDDLREERLISSHVSSEQL